MDSCYFQDHCPTPNSTDIPNGAPVLLVNKSEAPWFKMADASVVGWGFTDMKLQRRRPSKRETTRRPFVVVKSWESARSSNLSATPEKKSPPSPEFPKQKWQSENQPNIEHVVDDSTIKDDHFCTDYIPNSPVNGISNTADSIATWPAFDKTNLTTGYVNISPVNGDTSPINNTGTITDSEAKRPAVDKTIPRRNFKGPDHNVLWSLSGHNGSCDERNSDIFIETSKDKAEVQVNPSQIKGVKQNVSDASFNNSWKQVKQIENESPISKRASLRKTRGIKRKQAEGGHDEIAENENIYFENRFVRIFNADQGRKVSVTEITDLDVVLTAIEEEALQCRDQVETDIEKQSIKEFFIQTRKSFGNCIDLQREAKGMKSDLRKAKGRLKKIRSELLTVQEERTRIRGALAKLEKQKGTKMANDKDLSDITNFVEQMKGIQRMCPMRDSASGTTTMDNLPSVMSQLQTLLLSMTHLQVVNTEFEHWLTRH